MLSTKLNLAITAFGFQFNVSDRKLMSV